jgi:hypothetical protein
MEQLTNHFDVDYIESDSVAIYSDAPGVIRSLPVVILKSSAAGDPGECFVNSGGQYIPPQRLPGFQRVEQKPEFRKPSSKATRFDFEARVYETQLPPLSNAPNISIRERLAAAQWQWAEETKTTEEKT